ncbi:hypothetical protein ACEU0C_003451 [Stenotrophomonas indicatrix]|uniref:hypothetical protein n=1 Tax=Stenotrophomonas indicatrix TaxID=2045451 RepID=UPI00373133DA
MSKWPVVPLGEVCKPALHLEEPQGGILYRQVGVRLWGEGAYERERIDGASTKYTTFNRIEVDSLIVNKIWARHGSVAVATPELDGGYVSPEFPVYALDRDVIMPEWMRLITKWHGFWEACNQKAQGTSGKNRIKPREFLSIDIPLPSLVEQRSIIDKFGSLCDKSAQLESHLKSVESDAETLLALSFRRWIAKAPYRPMREVAPVEKRSVMLDSQRRYREVGARSFGRGLFAKPDFNAGDATWQKPVWIKAGDLVFSNIKAWEGAIALAGNECDGAIASHRYITCVPCGDLLGNFLLYYLLSSEGLEKVGEASAGTADRNRTLGLKRLEKIEVPVPPLAAQREFTALQSTVSALKLRHKAIRENGAAIAAAALEKVFT